MTKLAHRVSTLEDQQFLIIHATADGEDRAPSPQKPPGAEGPLGGDVSLSNCLFLFSSTEKIHFQHTAELITQLIKGKANYSLQVWDAPCEVLRAR